MGTEGSRGFATQEGVSIESTTTDTGWDTFLWDSTFWDDTTTVVDTFSESSVKRYFPVQKELNSVQWGITTNTLDANYILRTLQTWGTETLAGKPRAWKA